MNLHNDINGPGHVPVLWKTYNNKNVRGKHNETKSSDSQLRVHLGCSQTLRYLSPTPEPDQIRLGWDSCIRILHIPLSISNSVTLWLLLHNLIYMMANFQGLSRFLFHFVIVIQIKFLLSLPPVCLLNLTITETGIFNVPNINEALAFSEYIHVF